MLWQKRCCCAAGLAAEGDAGAGAGPSRGGQRKVRAWGGRGPGGVGMTTGCVAVCSRRRPLASCHLPLPFPGTLSLRRRRRRSASHPPVPSLPLPGPIFTSLLPSFPSAGCAEGRGGTQNVGATPEGTRAGTPDKEEGHSKAGEPTRTAGTGNQNGANGGACAWEAATIKGMAWPANPVATGCQGNPCSTGIRWGVSPAAQMGCLRNRSGSPSGADQP